MIFIKNQLRSQKVDNKAVQKDIQILLDELDYADFDISIWFTTNVTIRKYNREYRKKDKATDILSFPYHPDLKPGEHIQVKDPEDKNLGDIIISVEYVECDAQNLGVTLEQRIKRLLVHGVCHLLGYDHIQDDDYKIMLAQEKKLLKKITD